jgi:hypothetical protein
MTKKCVKCSIVKEFSDFPIRDKSKMTFRTSCKKCYNNSNKRNLIEFKYTSLKNEVWKDVSGYKGIYMVSNFSRVRSINHKVCCSNGRSRIQVGRIITSHLNKKGYLQVSLSNKGKILHTFVHRLSSIAFIPNPENELQVNHINGIKTDNRIENLEWCTNRENQLHAVKNNLINPNSGEKHHNSKLTNKQVVRIRELHKTGITNIKLALYYNISATAMSKILRNETYINI